MSEFKTDKITATNLVQGDHSSIVLQSAAVDSLADTNRQIQAALAQLQAEMARSKPSTDRIRDLLSTLGTGAGALTAIVESIAKVRQAAGR